MKVGSLISRKYCLWGAAIILILNIFCMSRFSLSEDGAHYVLYGVHLAWGYVDHPPLIGWMQGAILSLFGNHDWPIHISSLVTTLLILYLIFHLSRLLFVKQHQSFPYICLLAAFLSVVFLALSMLVLTQNPLRLFCLLTIFFLWRAIKSNNLSDFILLGCSLGLAGMSDYTAFVFALGLGCYVLIFERSLLKEPKLYLSLVISAIIVSPFILWNINHDFISFATGSHRIANHPWSLHDFLISLLIQFSAYSPVLVVMSIVGSISAIRTKDQNQLLLVMPAIPIILMFVISGGFQVIDFHWPALGWVLLIPVAVNATIRQWHRFSVRCLTYFSCTLTVVLCILFYFQVLVSPIIISPGRSPLYELYGWQEAADHATVLAKKLEMPLKADSPLFVNSWPLASRLAWYSGHSVQIATPTSIAAFYQFSQWYGKPQRQSDGIMVAVEHWSQPSKTSSSDHQFAHCDLIDSLPIIRGNKQVNKFVFYHCWDYNS